MLTINLVSQDLKREIKLRHLYRFFKKINYILIVIVFLIASSLLGARAILQSNFNRIVEETSLVNKSSQTYSNKVKGINSELKTISKIQESFVPWSSALTHLATITPENVTYGKASFSLVNNSIVINGHADDRASLLDLKNNMETCGFFSNIDFPTKNILKKEDIDFEIKAVFDINKFKNE